MGTWSAASASGSIGGPEARRRNSIAPAGSRRTRVDRVPRAERRQFGNRSPETIHARKQGGRRDVHPAQLRQKVRLFLVWNDDFLDVGGRDLFRDTGVILIRPQAH